MKFILSLILVLGMLLAGPVWAAKTYLLDPDHTYITWHVDHFGFSTISGKAMADGSLTLYASNPEKSRVAVTIHTGTMQTGIPRLDDVLRGANFFDTAEYASGSFISTKVEVTGVNTAKVYGLLTLRGIARPVVLNVKLNKIGKDPVNGKETVGFSANGVLKRSDFKMTGYLPGIGDEVSLNIQAEAVLGKIPINPADQGEQQPSNTQ